MNVTERSNLISAELEGKLSEFFKKLSAPVVLCCIAAEDEKSGEMQIFLKHLVSLSDKLTLHIAAPGENPEWERLFGLGLYPATAFWNDSGFCRASFHGVPGGHELSSFITEILTAGGGSDPLDRPTLHDISRIKNPIELIVCVSLSCQHCAKLVMAGQRIAFENANVTTHMVDANLYPELVAKYQIQRVPVIVSGDRILAVGGMTLFELSSLLRKQEGA